MGTSTLAVRVSLQFWKERVRSRRMLQALVSPPDDNRKSRPAGEMARARAARHGAKCRVRRVRVRGDVRRSGLDQFLPDLAWNGLYPVESPTGREPCSSCDQGPALCAGTFRGRCDLGYR